MSQVFGTPRRPAYTVTRTDRLGRPISLGDPLPESKAILFTGPPGMGKTRELDQARGTRGPARLDGDPGGGLGAGSLENRFTRAISADLENLRARFGWRRVRKLRKTVRDLTQRARNTQHGAEVRVGAGAGAVHRQAAVGRHAAGRPRHHSERLRRPARRTCREQGSAGAAAGRQHRRRVAAGPGRAERARRTPGAAGPPGVAGGGRWRDGHEPADGRFGPDVRHRDHGHQSVRHPRTGTDGRPRSAAGPDGAAAAGRHPLPARGDRQPAARRERRPEPTPHPRRHRGRLR